MYADLVFEDDATSPEEVLQEAMEFKLTFGRHKRVALKEMLVTKAGRSYLMWILNLSDAREYIKEYVKTCINYYQVRQAKPT